MNYERKLIPGDIVTSIFATSSKPMNFKLKEFSRKYYDGFKEDDSDAENAEDTCVKSQFK